MCSRNSVEDVDEAQQGQAEQVDVGFARPVDCLLTRPVQRSQLPSKAGWGAQSFFYYPFSVLLPKICLEADKVCLSNPLMSQRSNMLHEITKIFSAWYGLSSTGVNPSFSGFQDRTQSLRPAERSPAHPRSSALIREPVVQPVLQVPSGLFMPLGLAKFTLSAWFSSTFLTSICLQRGDRDTRSSQDPSLALSPHSFIPTGLDSPPLWPPSTLHTLLSERLAHTGNFHLIMCLSYKTELGASTARWFGTASEKQYPVEPQKVLKIYWMNEWMNEIQAGKHLT